MPLLRNKMSTSFKSRPFADFKDKHKRLPPIILECRFMVPIRVIHKQHVNWLHSGATAMILPNNYIGID